MVRTALTDLLGIESPLVGFNRTPAVVAEVTKAGGLGVLGANAYTADELDQQLTWIEQQVGGRPYGVDLLVPGNTANNAGDVSADKLRAMIPKEHLELVDGILAKYGVPTPPKGASNYDDALAGFNPEHAMALVEVAFQHKIALIANALGTPPPALVARGKKEGVAVAALVGQPKHAQRQLEAGVDILVAQGYEAGGHTGDIASMVLTPSIVELAGDTPVLAAGGIASGNQMAAALALGAAGVWLGSVWLNSHEDMTPLVVKQKYLEASAADTVRSKLRTGKPARQLRSAFHDEWDASGTQPLPMPLQSMLVQPAFDQIDAFAADGHEGAYKLESFIIGQVVGSFKSLRPAYDITREIIADCDTRIKLLNELVRDTADRS